MNTKKEMFTVEIMELTEGQKWKMKSYYETNSVSTLLGFQHKSYEKCGKFML